MRFVFLLIISAVLLSCSSLKSVQNEVALHRGTFPLQQLASNIPSPSVATDIAVKSSSGLPARSEVVRAGGLVVPLIFYNHFQSNFQVVLGQDVLDDQWNNYVEKRLGAFAATLAKNGIDHVQLELKKAMAHGKYIAGHAYIIVPSYYSNVVESINLSRSKDATAEAAIALSWTDNTGQEQSRDASIKLSIAKNGLYSGQVRTLMGKTITLSGNDIQFHFDHDIQSRPVMMPNHPMMAVHLFRLSDLLVLSLDKLCEMILLESKGAEVKPLPATFSATQLQAQNLLWERLKGNKLGVRFTRGYSTSGGFRSGSYYDFVSNKAGLTVDVGAERNKMSVEQYLFTQGQRTTQFHHLYFAPEEILNNTNAVVERIKSSFE